MLTKLKHAVKHSAVYSISNVATKAIGIILLPIYTDYFTPEQYGDLGLLLITITIISQVLVAGQGQSVIRFNNAQEYNKDKRSIFFTLTLMLICIVAVFTVASEFVLPKIIYLFSRPTEYYLYFRITIYIISFTILNIIFLNQLRADERSVAYSVIGVAKLLITLLLTIYLIVYNKQGIEAVLYGQLAGELVNLILIIPMMIKKMDFRINKAIIPESLKFGFPLIFGALAMNLLNGSDRYVLKYLAGARDLGLYELGYKFAGVLNMFVIMPFSLTLMPMAYNYYKKAGDVRFYSKIMTYFTFVLVWGGLAVSMFSRELIIIFSSSSSFYPAYIVVPWITLSYVIFGMSMVASLGMYLTGKTNSVAIINLIAAGLNLALNFWLIPILGMLGAAIDTLIAFVFLLIFSHIAASKQYKVNFEINKLIILLLLGVIIYLLSTYLDKSTLFVSLSVKVAILFIFPFILIPFKFYEENELITIKKIFTLILHPLKSKNKLIELFSNILNNKAKNE